MSFEGEGCAIFSSASILTDILKGRDLILQKIANDFLEMLKNKTKINLNSLSEDQITTISSLSRTRVSNESKCATMAWHALLSALENNK